MQVLDVGTGSGNITVSLAQERPDWNVTGTDISQEALRYAEINARMNSVENRVRLIQTDLWQGLEDMRFDALVSNPPYLTSDELEMLQPEVAFEPRSSLDGGRDGLAFFKRIIQNAHAILKPNGFIFFEVGLEQAEKVCELFKINGFHNIERFKDDSQIDRIVSAQLGLHG
jgi:release factor glutamine methyltransferase